MYKGTGGKFANGFTVEVYDSYNNLVVSKKVSKSVDVEPGTVINMPAFKVDYHLFIEPLYVGCNTFDYIGRATHITSDEAYLFAIDNTENLTDEQVIKTIKDEVDYYVGLGNSLDAVLNYIGNTFQYRVAYGYNLHQNTTYKLAGVLLDANANVVSNVARVDVTTDKYAAPGSTTGAMSYGMLTKSNTFKNVSNFTAPASVNIVRDPADTSKFTIKDAWGISGKDLSFTVDSDGNIVVDDCDTGLTMTYGDPDQPVSISDAFQSTKDNQPDKVWGIKSYYDSYNRGFVFYLCYGVGGYTEWGIRDYFEYPVVSPAQAGGTKVRMDEPKPAKNLMIE